MVHNLTKHNFTGATDKCNRLCSGLHHCADYIIEFVSRGVDLRLYHVMS